MKHINLTEWTMKMERQKTLTEWFDDLSLLDKMKLYNCRAEHEQELINNLFQPEESRDSQVDGTD